MVQLCDPTAEVASCTDVTLGLLSALLTVQVCGDWQHVEGYLCISR